MEVEKYGVGVFSIDSFLSVEECLSLIKSSEKMTFEKATIQAIDGPKLDEEIRSNDRIIFDDVELSMRLYQRAKDLLPQSMDGW